MASPKGAQTYMRNQRIRNEVGHFIFHRFLHVFGMSPTNEDLEALPVTHLDKVSLRYAHRPR
jgi:hypothetical protein